MQSLIRISWKLCLQYSFVTLDSTDNDFNFTDSRARCWRITLSPFRSIFVANDEVIIWRHARIEPCNLNLKLAILAGSWEGYYKHISLIKEALASFRNFLIQALFPGQYMHCDVNVSKFCIYNSLKPCLKEQIIFPFVILS